MVTLIDTETSTLASVVGAEQPAPTPTRRTARTATRPAAAKPPARVKTARARPEPAGNDPVELPADLVGPVELALAKAAEDVPGPHALPGGSRYELKWDGYRGVIVRRPQDTRLWSRQRNDMTTQFPEIIAAAAGLPPGTVVDGEVVIWNGARLDFDLLQKRFAGGTAKVAAQVRAHPASFVAFDLIAYRGEDLRRRPFTERRELLETLAAECTPALTLSPITDDVEQARKWMASYRPAGIEGLVVKGATSRYEPGARRWLKHKSRETVEVIVGGVTGPISRPESIVAGLYRDRTLTIVGRSVPLKPAQARSLAAVLKPAGQEHPWPNTIASNRFGGSRDRTALTKVNPTVVAEVSADTALQGGVWRHPLRFLRHRPDLGPGDLDQL